MQVVSLDGDGTEPARSASDGPPRRPRGGDRWRVLAVPALLLVVAGIGVFRSVTLDQSSWHGVSFGMFATYDNVASRTVRLSVDRGAGPVRTRLPPDLADEAGLLEVVPTDGRARRLAESVLRRVPDGTPARVVVEVWRVRIRDAGGVLRLGTAPLAAGQARR